MNRFRQQTESAGQAQALMEKVDALIQRADALIHTLEELAEAGRGPRDLDLTSGLYGILSYTGRGESNE